MPRRRFEELDPARRAALLDAATAEFAAHGYEGASQNRIIERAGISKGALYYYFDDKRDLFITALKVRMAEFLAYIGPIGPAGDAEEFWTAIGNLYSRSVAYYVEHPRAVQLTRRVARAVSVGEELPWVAELRKMVSGWISGLVRVGQQLGAVRTDLPESLLVAVLLAISESIDLWSAERMEQFDPEELARLTPLFTRLIQRVAAPSNEDEADREVWQSIAMEEKR